MTNISQYIQTLDPLMDHQEIACLLTCYEFPFDTVRSLEYAQFRTFCSPRISGLLDYTGEFGRRTQKRYDDTDLILSEILEHGYDSERGRAALERMNSIHGRFSIANQDFLYVLSTIVFEPIRWNERFGWRLMTEVERLALFYYWREVGQRMGITGIPETFEEFERYNLQYERDNFRYCETNRRVGAPTCDLLLGWFLPGFLLPLGRPFLYALMDDALLDAFGFPRPSPAMRRVVEGAIKLRARAVRLLPPRRRPHLRTRMKHRSYPSGYRIEDLGAAVPAPSGRFSIGTGSTGSGSSNPKTRE